MSISLCSMLLSCLLLSVNAYTNSETNDYDPLSFKQMIEMAEEFSVHSKTVHVEDIFTRYPELQSNNCNCKPCYSPLIEMTNFHSNKEQINRRPTILAVAGLRNTQMIGPNSMFRLIEYFQKYQLEHDEIIMILNSVRVIFVPFANVENYFHRFSQTFGNNSGSSEIDGSLDFNWGTKKSCFLTNGARIVNRLVKDNLIVGLIHFDEEGNDLEFPWGRYESLKESLDNPEQKVFESITQTFLKISKSKNKIVKEVVDFANSQSELKLYDGPGSLEDWAFAGSFRQDMVNANCLKQTSPYNELFLEVDSVSNRIFALKVNNKPQKELSDARLGNELSLFSRKSPASRIGYISRNILVLQQFFQNIRPVFDFNYIWRNKKETNATELIIDIQFFAQGCNNVEAIQVENKDFRLSGLKISKNIYEEGSQSIVVDTQIAIPLKMFDGDKGLDVEMKMVCDSNWKTQFAESHFLRSKLSDDYSVNKGEFTVNGADNSKIKIYNVKRDIVSSALAFQKVFNQIELVYSNKLTVRFGDQNMFQISFKKKSRKAFIEIDPDFKEDKQNKDILELLNKNIDDLQLIFFEEHEYYYTPPDNSVIKNQTKFEIQKQEAENRPRNFVRNGNNKNVDLTMKLLKTISVCQTLFFDLIGKRVILSLDPENKENDLQGTVMVHQYNSKEIEVTLRDGAKNNMFQIKNEGLMVPLEGLNCSSKSIFSAGKVDDTVSYYKLFISVDQKNEAELRFQLDLQTSQIMDKLYLEWSDTKIELTKVEGIFVGHSKRSLFRVGGMQVKVFVGDETRFLFECSPEKSSIESDAKEIADVQQSYDERRKQVIGFEDYVRKEISHIEISIVFVIGLLLLVSLFGGLFCCFNGKGKENTHKIELDLLS